MIEKQLEIIHQLEGLPISVYDSAGYCLKMYPELPYVSEYNLSDLHDQSGFEDYVKQVTCLLTDSLLLIGFIPDTANKQLIIIGPVSTVPLNSYGLSQITEHLSKNYSQDLVKAVTGLLSSMKLMDIDRFQNIITLIDSITNDEVHEIRTIQGNSLNTTQSNAIKKMTSAINAEVTFDDHDFTDTDIQDRILFYISKGMVEDLEQIRIPDFLVEMMNHIDIRRAKNSMIVLNSLSQRAALAAGVPLRATDSLGRAFSDQIESCPNIDTLNQLSAHMFIPAAYARLVRDVNVPGNTSRDIRTVISVC